MSEKFPPPKRESCRVMELRCREVVSIRDGARYGFAGDVEIELATGQARALIVPGAPKFLGLIGRGGDTVIPWERVARIGDEIILVDI